MVSRLVADQRNDPVIWNGLYERAVEMAESVDVEPSRPRAPNVRQQHRQNVPADTISDYWKRNMFYPFVDHLTTELSDRLLQVEDRLNAQYLIPSNLANLTDDKIQSIYITFQTDLPAQDVAEFESEIRRWKTRHSVDETPHSTLGETLANTNSDLYPNIVTCLHILLAMPVSTATAERSFSSMRRLKPIFDLQCQRVECRRWG